MAKKELKKLTREERIQKICETVNKGQFGGENKDAVTYLGSREVKKIGRFCTGSPDLDAALGGGLPVGRFIELFGAESSGKTTLCYHIMKEFQKAYPEDEIALIDSEYAFDEVYAEQIGLNTKYLIVNQPEHGEQAMNVMGQLITLGTRLIIVDSVAGLTTKAEMEGEYGASHVAQLARLMSNSLKKLAQAAGRTETTIIFTNQMRDKIGVTYGDKSTTPGGNALKFYASVRINLRRMDSETETVNGQKVRISNRVRAEVKKNKTAPPFRSADFHITFGIGIDEVGAFFTSAITKGIIDKKGAWFSYDGENLGQGQVASIEAVRNNEILWESIKNAVLSCTDEEAETETETETEEPESPEEKPKAPIKKPSISKSKEGTKASDSVVEKVAVEDDDFDDLLDDDVEVDDV